MEDLCFIVNPASRSGKSRARIGRLRGELRRRFPEARWVQTEGPRHAIDLVKGAVRLGYRRIVAVGGDGTMNEVAHGILGFPVKQRPAFGVIASGTGGDFARRLLELFPFPRDFSWLENCREFTIDAGEVRAEDLEGRPFLRHFINVADAGISGEVVRRVNASHKRFASLAYPLATVSAARTYRPPRVQVTVETMQGKRSESELDLLLAVVANGRYFGGGMCIAPEAELDDGRLDFLIASKVPYLTLLKELLKVYRKQRIRHPLVRYREGPALSLAALEGEIPLDLDGEYFLVRKADFRILPSALRVLVPDSLPRKP